MRQQVEAAAGQDATPSCSARRLSECISRFSASTPSSAGQHGRTGLPARGAAGVEKQPAQHSAGSAGGKAAAPGGVSLSVEVDSSGAQPAPRLRPTAGHPRNPVVKVASGTGSYFLKQVKAFSEAKVVKQKGDVAVSEGVIATWVEDLSDPWPVRFYCEDSGDFANFVFGGDIEPPLSILLPDFPFLGDPHPTQLVLPARRDYLQVQLFMDSSGRPTAEWDKVPAPIPSAVKLISDGRARDSAALAPCFGLCGGRVVRTPRPARVPVVEHPVR